jgi:uncharacterized secreted protein with C-terminal beta-propeller domain
MTESDTNTVEVAVKKERKVRQLSGLEQYVKDHMPDKKVLREKFEKEWEEKFPEEAKKRREDKESENATKKAAKAVEPARLPRTVAALTPEEQSAWVAKQIESLNRRLSELSDIRAGTAVA